MKNLTKMTAVILTTLALLAGSTLMAQEGAAKKVDRPLPFHGTISSVDKDAGTVTLKGQTSTRVFHTSADTRIVKNGKPATLADAVVGEVIGGSYRKAADGQLNAISLRLGPKPEDSAKKEKKEKKDE